MRRLSGLLSMVFLLLGMLTLGMWVYTSAIRHLFVGHEQVEIDQFTTRTSYRNGLVAADGRLTWGSGTQIQFYRGDVARQPPAFTDRRGFLTGDFDFWAGTDAMRPLFGFGSYEGPVINNLMVDDRELLSVPLWFVAMLLFAWPIWRGAGRRYELTPVQVRTGWAVTCIVAIGWAWTACYEWRLAIMFLAIIAGHVGWAIWKFGVRSWWQRRTQQRAHVCRVCGYDLRATPDAYGPLLERCPECGTYSRPLIRNHG